MALGNVLLLALIFVTVGFIGGTLAVMLFASRGKKEPEETPPAEETLVAHEKRETETAIPEKPVSIAGDEIEVLRLLRSRSSNKLIAILDEKRFESVQAMDERLRQQTALLTREWLIWMGAPAEERQKPPRHKHTVADIAPQQSPSATTEETQTPPSPVLTTANKAPNPPITNVLREEKAPPALLSIVQQIDEVLQEMLPGSSLAGKTVKLAEDPKEGVIVWIGARRYHGIDAVDDEEAKALLRAAVAEWERRTERR